MVCARAADKAEAVGNAEEKPRRARECNELLQYAAARPAQANRRYPDRAACRPVSFATFAPAQ